MWYTHVCAKPVGPQHVFNIPIFPEELGRCVQRSVPQLDGYIRMQVSQSGQKTASVLSSDAFLLAALDQPH